MPEEIRSKTGLTFIYLINLLAQSYNLLLIMSENILYIIFVIEIPRELLGTEYPDL